MTKRFHRQFIHTASVLVLSTLMLPVGAAADDWNLRVLGQWVTTSADELAQLDEGPGLYLGLERRLSERWGVEAGLGWNQLEGSESFRADLGSIRIENTIDFEQDWLPVSVAGNFHLTPQSRFDLYISGRAGWAFFDDLKIRQFERIDREPPDVSTEVRFNADLPAEDAFFYGLRLGFDLPFGDSGWALSTSVDWTVLELEIDYGVIEELKDAGKASFDVDPVTFGVGVSKRF